MLLNILQCMGQLLSAKNFCYLIAKSCLTLFFNPHGLWPARLFCPWDFQGMNTGVGCHSLLEGIFPTQGLNLHLLSLLHWHTAFFFFFFLTTKPPGKPQQRITWPQKCWSWAILNQTVIPKGSCYLQHCIPRLVLGTQQRLNKCWLNKQSHLATMRSLGKGHFASPILPWSTSAPPNSV